MGMPAFVMLILSMTQLFLLKRHDKVLYRFCQFRRELISFTHDKFDTLDDKEKEKISQLVDQTNYIIHEFPSLKRSVFRMKFFSNITFFTKQEFEKVEVLLFQTDNKDLKGLLKKQNLNILYASYSYTPFFVVKFCFILLTVLGNLFVRVGITQMKEALDNVSWYKDVIKKIPSYESELETEHHMLIRR